MYKTTETILTLENGQFYRISFDDCFTIESEETMYLDPQEMIELGKELINIAESIKVKNEPIKPGDVVKTKSDFMNISRGAICDVLSIDGIWIEIMGPYGVRTKTKEEHLERVDFSE